MEDAPHHCPVLRARTRTATFAWPDSNLTYGTTSSNAGVLSANQARKVRMWLRGLRKRSVSKSEGVVRGGGGRRAKGVRQPRSDVADGKMVGVALGNHAGGVQTPLMVNEIDQWRWGTSLGSGAFDRRNMTAERNTTREIAVSGARRERNGSTSSPTTLRPTGSSSSSTRCSSANCPRLLSALDYLCNAYKRTVSTNFAAQGEDGIRRGSRGSPRPTH